MSAVIIRWARRVLSVFFTVLAIAVLAVGLGARLGPAAGYEFFSIRTGSMEPSLPVGSLAIVAADSGAVAEGDAIAFRLPSGVVVTHRVVEVVQTDTGTFLRTQGDANQNPDPSLVPESAVVGPVEASVPILGFLLAMLGMPIGLVAILSVAGTLITAIWLLEELEQLDADDDEPRPVALPPLAGDSQ